MAIRLLQLREHACPPRAYAVAVLGEQTPPPRDQVLSHTEWHLLYMTTHQCAPPAQAPSAAGAVQALATLGGWMDTQGSGRPAWQAIWRAWFRLNERVNAHLPTLNLCQRSDQ